MDLSVLISKVQSSKNGIRTPIISKMEHFTSVLGPSRCIKTFLLESSKTPQLATSEKKAENI
ncbi:hypothetical protein [Candidatus Enterococcus huntleyi]|uniref:hypothetical protein n=1 Tax=Candidatus Enterococcus huntleyi TaxID=1857217 RepID=UPI00137B407A|nr:hypothetical protein [Enterococcus sp. JM4C]